MVCNTIVNDTYGNIDGWFPPPPHQFYPVQFTVYKSYHFLINDPHICFNYRVLYSKIVRTLQKRERNISRRPPFFTMTCNILRFRLSLWQKSAPLSSKAVREFHALFSAASRTDVRPSTSIESISEPWHARKRHVHIQIYSLYTFIEYISEPWHTWKRHVHIQIHSIYTPIEYILYIY